MAPGEKIISLQVGGGYSKLSGTSQATPCVSGVLAIILSILKEKNKFDVDLAKQILYQSCDRIDYLDNHEQGHGVVNLPKAIDTAFEVT